MSKVIFTEATPPSPSSDAAQGQPSWTARAWAAVLGLALMLMIVPTTAASASPAVGQLATSSLVNAGELQTATPGASLKSIGATSAAATPRLQLPQVGFNNGKLWIKINRLDMTTAIFAGITASCTATFGIPGMWVCGSIGVAVRSQLARNPWANGVWLEISLSGIRSGSW